MTTQLIPNERLGRDKLCFWDPIDNRSKEQMVGTVLSIVH